MGGVFSVFQVAFSFARWIREPTFEVLEASFKTNQKKEGLSVVEGGLITVAAYGGGRTRRILNWKFMLFTRTEDGKGSGGGINRFVEPILETIPAHESTKFTVRVESGGVFKENPERLTGVLSLRLDKYWTDVEFPLERVSTGDFHFHAPTHEIVPWMPDPWWKRAIRRVARLV